MCHATGPMPPPQQSGMYPTVGPVHQPMTSMGYSQAPSPAPALPAELQTVVERVYLRDQGTQSEPPPLPGTDEHIIGEGAAPSMWAMGRRDQPYVGPAMQPLGEGERAQKLQELGDTNAGRLLRGLTPSNEPGPARRELRWRFEEEDPLQADVVPRSP